MPMSKSKSKCYPSYRLNGVIRHTVSGPHVAPHRPYRSPTGCDESDSGRCRQ